MLFKKFLSNLTNSFEPVSKNISTFLFVLVLIGAIITCIACATSTLATNVFHLTITHGLLGGIGAGTFYMFGLIVCNFYFEENRGLASGVSLTGGGVGVIMLSYLVNTSVAYYGWKGYFIIWGSMCLLGFPLAYIIYMVPHESDNKENVSAETKAIIGDEKVRSHYSKVLSESIRCTCMLV